MIFTSQNLHIFHLYLTLNLLQGAEHSLLLQAYMMVLLHGTEIVWWVLSTVPVELVQNQVFRFQYGWLPEPWVTGANQIKEHGVLQGRLCRWTEWIALMVFVCVLWACVHLHIGSYPVQYETCHSPVMCNRLCGSIDCFQSGMAMWAYSATCWLDAEHTVPTTVQVPLVYSHNRRGINQLHCLYDCSSFLNAAKVHHRGGQWNFGT